MADMSLMQDVSNDDCDEGVFEQGDCSTGSPTDEEVIPLLARIQKYSSGNIFERQKVVDIVADMFQTAPAQLLEDEIQDIMLLVTNLCEEETEYMVKRHFFKEITHMASQAMKCSGRVESLKTIVEEHLLPLLVRNLGDPNCDAAGNTLLELMRQGLISKAQVEVQVCPTILAISKEKIINDILCSPITLMGKMVPLLGRDVTERVFLSGFSELCSSKLSDLREMCAHCIDSFCAVVSKEQFEKVLLPCFVALCKDNDEHVQIACTRVIMFVSSVCSPELRISLLTPLFVHLLDDRQVQMSALKFLGPFISTFADPPIASISFDAQGYAVFINRDGTEYMPKPPSRVDMYDHYMSKQVNLTSVIRSESNSEDTKNWFASSEESDPYPDLDDKPTNNSWLDGISSSSTCQTDEDIKEIVESVKNAVLSYRNVEQEHGVIGDNLKNNLSNDNVINNVKESTTCDNLGSTITEITDATNTFAAVECPVVTQGGCAADQVIQMRDTCGKDDDNLQMFNSYNYWYISPDMPLDLNLCEEGLSTMALLSSNEESDLSSDVSTSNLQNLYSNMLLSDSTLVLDSSQHETSIVSESDSSTEVRDILPVEPEQDIVPQILITKYIKMAYPEANSDYTIFYHCAYAMPAVALTLGSYGWPLLKKPISLLANSMYYQVRRIVASSLHELAIIFGREVSTEHLTPIFEDFLKDLDEVRLEVLKNMALFLQIIAPETRMAYLPRLFEFVKTENDSNWRWRQELTKQLLLLVPLFAPADSSKYIGALAKFLLYDVSAVRQVAINVIAELLKHIYSKPSVNSLFLVKLVEEFAHSKKWKCRQTFALICFKVLSCNALPPDQFATDMMPQLLDLSWDPVANVRLIVAKTLAQHIISNEYFADPSNQHFDSLGTVIRRLQSDKDRDVRQFAEVTQEKPSSPSPKHNND